MKHRLSFKDESRNVGNGKKRCNRKGQLQRNLLPKKPRLLKAVKKHNLRNKKIVQTEIDRQRF